MAKLAPKCPKLIPASWMGRVHFTLTHTEGKPAPYCAKVVIYRKPELSQLASFWHDERQFATLEITGDKPETVLKDFEEAFSSLFPHDLDEDDLLLYQQRNNW